MKTTLFNVLCILLVFFASCSHKTPCPICTEAPPVIAMRIIDKTNFTDLLYNKTYSTDTLKVYYIDKNIQVMVALNFQTDTLHHRIIISSGDWAQKSINGIKNFFIKLNNQDTDTATVNIVLQKSECCSSYALKQFTVNNLTLTTDSTNSGFLLKK